MFIEIVGNDEFFLISEFSVDFSFLKIFVICFGVGLGRGNKVGS